MLKHNSARLTVAGRQPIKLHKYKDQATVLLRGLNHSVWSNRLTMLSVGGGVVPVHGAADCFFLYLVGMYTSYA